MPHPDVVPPQRQPGEDNGSGDAEAAASPTVGRHQRAHPGRRSSGRALLPLSIRASLLIVVLIPLAIAVSLSSTVVLRQSSTRRQAVTTRQASLALDALLRARVGIYAEYVPSAAIVAAQAYHLTLAQLDALLDTNFQASLVTARRDVDQESIFKPKGMFAATFLQLVALRERVDNRTATPLQVETFFNQLGSRIDTQWMKTYTHLVQTSGSSDSTVTQTRLVALGATFSAFTSGLGEESLRGGGSLETVLTTAPTPAQVQSLVISQEQFESAVRGFPDGFGPRGTEAWKALKSSRLDADFSNDVQRAVTVGLGHQSPPYATDTAAIPALGKAEVAWDTSLTNVVLASSSDLRSATASQADSATRDLYIAVLGVLVLMMTAIGAVLILGRAVRRPLALIVAAATSVREGELELPLLDESGPKELAVAAGAFNEMSSTLRAVQEQAIALSEGDLDDPVLQRSLPGRTGAALQTALTTLQMSVRANERQRAALAEQATRDSLTGLLNRGAAHESLKLDLANVHRSNGELELTVLFIDLDELKTLNDTFGHDRGDAAIRSVADALRAATRTSDVVARIGGDEFVVGSLEPRGSGAPELLARRISVCLSESSVGDESGAVGIGCSIGVAVSEPSDERIEMLIERADRALYVAKENGRGQVSWAHSG